MYSPHAELPRLAWVLAGFAYRSCSHVSLPSVGEKLQAVGYVSAMVVSDLALCWTAMQAGIAPGKMVKICPHNSTGRADYFGAVVNRAARLLCAAQPGQVLIEEQVMESVIREWNRTAETVSAAARPLVGIPPVNRPSMDLKRLMNLSSLFQPTRLKEQAPAGSGDLAPLPLQRDQPDQGLLPPMNDAFELSSRSRSVPLNAIRRMNPGFGNATPSKVTFEGVASIESSPRTSLDGNIRRDSLDLAQPSDQVIESCCPPCAAKSPLAVSNCHMLKFLHSSGRMIGRKESGVLRGRQFMSLASLAGRDPEPAAVPSSRRPLLSAGNSLDSGVKLSLLDKLKTPTSFSIAKGWVQDAPRSNSDSPSHSISSVPAQGMSQSIQCVSCQAQ